MRPPARPTGAQIVYDALRREIMALKLAPGSGLDEVELCRRFRLSRTPVREALIRLASEGLAQLYPNRGARVATLDFADVVDHYEAMDLFMPIAAHFAAERRTAEDLKAMRAALAGFRAAIGRKNAEEMIRANYELHAAIAAACHNRSIERGYRQMLADKLRLAQHALPGTSFSKGQALADRLRGAASFSEQLVRAIASGKANQAERLAAQLNDYARRQVIDELQSSLAPEVRMARLARQARQPRRTR
jgi:DNA-binding GntR family transcriptional regulator